MAKVKVEIELQDAYDTEEVATILNIGIATVWRWIAKGKLPSFKLSGRTLIPKREVERLQTAGVLDPVDNGQQA
ncbi:hypothetical protein ES706_04776 [subsurface metagenome]